MNCVPHGPGVGTSHSLKAASKYVSPFSRDEASVRYGPVAVIMYSLLGQWSDKHIDFTSLLSIDLNHCQKKVEFVLSMVLSATLKSNFGKARNHSTFPFANSPRSNNCSIVTRLLAHGSGISDSLVEDCGKFFKCV